MCFANLKVQDIILLFNISVFHILEHYIIYCMKEDQLKIKSDYYI